MFKSDYKISPFPYWLKLEMEPPNGAHLTKTCAMEQ